MRKIIFIAIFLTVLGSAWVFYLQESNKRFVKSLPHVPLKAKPTIRVYEAPDKPSDKPLYFQPLELERLQRAEAERLQHLEGETPSKPTKEQADIGSKNASEIPHRHPHPDLHEHDHGSETSPIEKEPLEKKTGSDREFLRQQSGNMKEIDVVRKYMSSTETTGGKKMFTVSTEESLEFLRAVNALWPTPEGKKALADAIKEKTR